MQVEIERAQIKAGLDTTIALFDVNLKTFNQQQKLQHAQERTGWMLRMRRSISPHPPRATI